MLASDSLDWSASTHQAKHLFIPHESALDKTGRKHCHHISRRDNQRSRLMLHPYFLAAHSREPYRRRFSFNIVKCIIVLPSAVRLILEKEIFLCVLCVQSLHISALLSKWLRNPSRWFGFFVLLYLRQRFGATLLLFFFSRFKPRRQLWLFFFSSLRCPGESIKLIAGPTLQISLCILRMRWCALRC